VPAISRPIHGIADALLGDEPAASLPGWRDTTLVLAVALVLTFAGQAFVIPFLPLYLQQLGLRDAAEVRLWSGVLAAVGSAGFAVAAPLWGWLADRVGRKPMVLRAMGLGGLALAASAAVQSPEQLMGVRLVLGLMSGPATASFALASVTVPLERLLRALGLLQIAVLLGQTIGPLVGGVLGDAIGLRATQVVGGGLTIGAALLVLIFARERFHRGPPSPGQGPVTPPAARPVRTILRAPMFLAALGGSVAIDFAWSVMNAALALWVQALSEAGRAVTLTGIIQGGFSLCAGLGALMTGWVARHFDFKVVLIGALVGSGLLFVPQAFAPTVWVLLGLRMAQGGLDGLALTSLNTLVGYAAPPEVRGTTYGVVASVAGAGAAVGPLVAGAAAAAFGLPVVFLLCTGVMGAGGVWVLARLRGGALGAQGSGPMDRPQDVP